MRMMNDENFMIFQRGMADFASYFNYLPTDLSYTP